MTDHFLLQHYMKDQNLSGISCIVVDEAHERSLNTDLLLALVKNLLCQRLDLRLIIMSATADAKHLAEYFFGCETFHVVGRNFPVDVRYVPCSYEGSSDFGNVASYASDVVRMVTEIHRSVKDGMTLAFLTSQMDVEWTCEKFQFPSAVSLVLHGKLSYQDQLRVFLDYPGKRKVIFSTIVAETSLTIPGVKYVVDLGMVKKSRFEPGTEPEIRRVHLGVAVLRILALGITDIQSFDFVDAPSATAIDMAMRNLIQLGAIVLKNDVLELTKVGLKLVSLGIVPWLGKIILQCFEHRLGKEGVDLAAVMANSSSIFCRLGNEEDKIKSDCIKVQFFHRHGDLFTLLSVYKEWEGVYSEHDNHLRNAIFSSLVENVAMYSGYDQLGYEMALTGKHVKLHPLCSLLVFGQRPSWVVFGDILSISNQYLVCVTSFDYEYLSTLCSPPLFDASKMESRMLQVRVLTSVSSTLLKKFCGKSNNNLHNLVLRIRTACVDERIGIEVNVDRNEIQLFALSQDMEKVSSLVNEVLEYKRKWLQNECMEKCLYHVGPGRSPSVALFGVVVRQSIWSTKRDV
ncbi:RNA helicase [Sarracenia purpurea var. burkii]